MILLLWIPLLAFNGGLPFLLNIDGDHPAAYIAYLAWCLVSGTVLACWMIGRGEWR